MIVVNFNANTVSYAETGRTKRINRTLTIIDEDFYNTDGNGVILIVEREDHLFAEAANPVGPFIGLHSEDCRMRGAPWLDSPNAVIEAWYSTFRDHGQLIRPNVRSEA